MTKVPMVIIVLALVLAVAALTLLGSVVVFDPNHRAEAVFIENNIHSQKL